MRAATGQDAERSAAERVIRLGRPDPGRIDDGAGRDLELVAGREVDDLEDVDRPGLAGSERMPVARTRVTARAPAAMAVRATASV